MKYPAKKLICLIFAAVLSFTCATPAFAAINESLLGDGFYVNKEEDFKYQKYTLASGVYEEHFYLNNAAGDAPKRCFAVEIDLQNSNNSILAGYNDGDTDEWSLRSVRTQAKNMAAKHNVSVVCSINGGFYDTYTGEPYGLLVMSGKLCHTPTGKQPYFAILKNGTAVIRDAGVGTADVVEGVEGGQRLVKGGKNVAPTAKREPRCAVGVKADGKVVFFVGDGRQLKSVGHTYTELANIMIALGCVEAIEMDGGASATMLTLRPSETELTLHHIPSLGDERSVSSSLHVAVTPAPTASKITIGSSVDFADINGTSMINITDNTSVRAAKTGIAFSYAKNAAGKLVLAAATLATGMQLVLEKSGKIADTKTVIVPGDTDCDGTISAADARIALRASVGLETISDAAAAAASVDGSAGISAADARLILRASVALENSIKWL